MKKFVAALLVLTMVLGMSSIAFAKTTRKFTTGMVEFKGSAYGYEKPGAKKSKVIIKKGSVAPVLESVIKNGHEWVLINVDHSSGTYLYFSADYLKDGKDKDKKIVFAAGGSGHSCTEDAVTDTKEEKKYPKYKHVQATGKVNIRQTASLAGKSAGVLRVGKKLTWTGLAVKDCRGVTFYSVKYTYKNQKVCWVSKEYTKLVK